MGTGGFCDWPRQHIKDQRRYFANKGPSMDQSQGYGFSSSHVWMWELDYKEGWALKNWCFSTALLKKTLESPLDCKEIKPINAKGTQSWIFIGKTDVEGETPILWPPDVNNWLIWKDPVAGKDWKQEEKGTTEDEVVGWHHRLNAHKFEHSSGSYRWKGSLESCSPWGHKETQLGNWTELNGEKDLGAIKEVYEKYLYKSLKYIKALGPLKWSLLLSLLVFFLINMLYKKIKIGKSFPFVTNLVASCGALCQS